MTHTNILQKPSYVEINTDELINRLTVKRLASERLGYDLLAKPHKNVTVYDATFPPENYHAPRSLISRMPNLNGAKVLDLGCGNGRFLEEMLKAEISPKFADGIDGSIKMLVKAKKKGYINLLHADLVNEAQLRPELDQYNIIVSTGVFGHILSGQLGVRTIQSYLKHTTKKAAVAISVGNAFGYATGSNLPSSPFARAVEIALRSEGFTDINTFIDKGHTPPEDDTFDVLIPHKYIYIIAKRK